MSSEYNPLDLLRIMRKEAAAESKQPEIVEVDLPFEELPLEEALPNKSLETSSAPELFTQSADVAFYAKLPPLGPDGFLVEINVKGGEAIFCVRELTVREAIRIEGSSFLLNSSGNEYFSSMNERKEILRHAISWIAQASTNTLIHNRHGEIIRLITDSAAEALWNEYSSRVYVDEAEARKIYTASKAYFEGKDPDGPLPLEAVYVNDMRRGWFHFSFQEYQDLKMSFYERMQIASMALAEVSAAEHGVTTAMSNSASEMQEMRSLPPEMYPPEVRARMGLG